jgi:heme-degrading monooxygenase HmoA
MTQHDNRNGTSIFRIDKFEVPDGARDEFLGRVRLIQSRLDAFEGCRQNLVLEQVGGPGRFNIVTIVEWATAEAMESARAAIAERYAAEGFAPDEFMARLGVIPDLANYAPVR